MEARVLCALDLSIENNNLSWERKESEGNRTFQRATVFASVSELNTYGRESRKIWETWKQKKTVSSFLSEPGNDCAASRTKGLSYPTESPASRLGVEVVEWFHCIQEQLGVDEGFQTQPQQSICSLSVEEK